MKKKNLLLTFLLYFSLMFFCKIDFAQQFSFVHISDIHVSDGTLGGSVGNNDSDGEQFQCTLKEINYLNPKPAFVVASGDISNVGSIHPDGMYDALTQHLYPQGGITNPANGAYFVDSAMTIPIYFVSGNHEYYKTIVPPVINDNLLFYPLYLGQDMDYYFTYNDAFMVFIRSGADRPIWQDLHPACVESEGIAAAQCQWLRSTLSLAGNKRKIIVMHHPPVNVNGTEIDGSPNTGTIAGPDDGSFLYNRETFMNICDSNNVDVVLAGHVHQFVVADRQGNVVGENWTASTRYCQTAQEFEGAYRIITVDSNFVSIGLPSVVNCLTVAVNNYEKKDYNIYPNPFINSTTLELPNFSDNAHYELRIYDMMGREVMYIPDIQNGKNTINRGSLLAGMYFYSLNDTKNIIGSGKLIIKD